MNLLRSDHAATLLLDGRILVADGQGTFGALNQAEIYNPSTESWTVAFVSLPLPRTFFTATTLASGKVLLAGGATAAQAELLDLSVTPPVCTSFPMVQNRTSHTATLLASGKVLLAGGQYGGSCLAHVELFDPALNAFTVTGAFHSIRAQATATVLGTKVLVVGGTTGNSPLSSGELYQ